MARAGGRLSARPLLCCQLLLLLVSASSFAPSDCRLRSIAAIAAHRHRHHRHPQKKPSSSSPPALLLLLGAVVAKSSSAAAAARIPPSPADRDASAISSVRNALSKPRSATFPLIECEFPSLPSLNKLGDGSLRSSMEAEDSNVSFVARLVGGLSSPMPVLFGPKVSVVTSTSAPASLVEKVRKSVSSGKGGGGGGVVVYSLKGGGSSIIPERAGGGGKKEVFVFLTPSSMGDYRAARELAESGRAVVIVNGSFKDLKTIPGSATMAYYVKPLTYNSQVAGYLVRAYPSQWTVLDAQTKEVLGSFDDGEILVGGTNTPDLRGSGRLVQRSVDERAIRARSGGGVK